MSATLAYDPTVGGSAYVETRRPITSPERAADELSFLGDADVEECWMLALNTRHHIIERVMISRGSIDHTFMSPREVYRAALQLNTAAIVLAHNHPSGDPNPSRDDERVTRRLAEAGELMGVDLLDHVVIGGTSWVSMARKGFV